MVDQEKPDIWVSDMLGGGKLHISMTVYPVTDFGTLKRRKEKYVLSEHGQKLSSGQNKYRRGEPLEEDEKPRKIFGRYIDQKVRKPIPEVFCVGAFFFVSQKVADLLGQFDLGGTQFSPIEIYETDQVERIAGDYYFLDLGCYKKTFVPEKSLKGFRQFNTKTPDRWSREFLFEDFKIAVAASSAEGADLWQDPRFTDAVFMSSGLENRLKQTGFSSKIDRYRCLVVDDAETGESVA